MLTNGAMNFIKEVLEATYVTQIRQMDQEKLKQFWKIFDERFSKYDEQDVGDAIEQITLSDKWFPTIARVQQVLSERTAAKRAKEQVYTYTAPPPRARIDMSVINGIREKIKRGEYKPTITNKVRAFAKRLFPDINDGLIRRNYCLLLHYCEEGSDLPGGGRVNLYMTKTGEIVERVVIPG